MTQIELTAEPMQLTTYAKLLIAGAMYDRGRQFIGASLLLRRQAGPQYPTIYLLALGLELIFKGCLLFADYDHFMPLLKRKGLQHDLVKCAESARLSSRLHAMRPPLREEFEMLNRLYNDHRLRYAGGHDLLIDPSTIGVDRIIRRAAALIRLMGPKLEAMRAAPST